MVLFPVTLSDPNYSKPPQFRHGTNHTSGTTEAIKLLHFVYKSAMSSSSTW